MIISGAGLSFFFGLILPIVFILGSVLTLSISIFLSTATTAITWSLQLSRSQKCLISCLCLNLVFGSFLVDRHHRTVATFQKIQKQTTLQLMVNEAPEISHGTQKFQAKIYPKGPAILVKNKPPHKDLHYGDIVQVKGRFVTVPPPSNPGQFDYQAFLDRKKIAGIFKVKQIQKKDHILGNPFKASAIWVRKQVHNLFKSTLDPPFDALLIGLVFGDHGVALPQDLEDRFWKVGLTHLLVVSGSQVSLVSGLVLNALRLSQFSRPIILGLVLACNAVFYFMTGGGASILRAILMNTLAVSVWASQRKTPPLHLIAFTAQIMLWLNPFFIQDLGALLSFLATFSLLYGVPVLEKQLPSTWPGWIKTLLATALAPFLWTTPLLVYTFQNISPISIISNLVAVQAIELLVVVGFFSTLFGLVYAPFALILHNFCLFLMIFLKKLVFFLSQIPGGLFYTSKPPFISIILIYSLILFAHIPINRFSDKKRYSIALVGIVLMALLWVIPTFFPRSYGSITFIDVGQGDATLIQTPQRKTILIDAGNQVLDWKTGRITYDYGRRIVAPVLRHYGINKIDLLIVSHFDRDHAGGIPAILEEFPVGILMDNGRFDDKFPSYHQLKHKAKKQLNAQAGQIIQLDKDTKISVLYPFSNNSFSRNKNNNSVSFLLDMKGHTSLFTGDLEKEGEALLAKHFGKQLNADILKAGHHGSHTSSTRPFLRAVTPKLAIVSAGRQNRYGHPHQSVMQRFEQNGTKVLGTDTGGAIELILSENKLRYKTYLEAK